MSDWGGIIGTVLGGVSGLAENLFGTSWEEEANAKEKELGDAPKFGIPQSQQEYEQLMQSKVGQNMPGYGDMLAQIEAQTAYQSVSSGMASGSQYGAMAGQNAAQSNRRRYLRQLGISNEGYKSNAEMGSIQATASRAPYEQAQFEYNEWLPWQIAKNEIASIRGTGQQQLMSGIDTLGAVGIYGSQLAQNNQSQSILPQTTYQSYNYGAAGANQLGGSQNLVTDPYGNRSGTGYIEPWMTQQF